MSLVLNFDARQFSPASVDGGSDQLPVSDGLGHRVVIIGDSCVPTKANKDSGGADPSTMLVLKVQVIEGPYQGMKGDYRLNIGNVKQEPKDIAYRQLSALCHAIGVFAVGNTSELYNKPFRVVVEQQAAPLDKYTQIKGVLTDQGIDPGNPTAGPRQAGPAPVQHQQAPAPQTFAPAPAPASFAPAPQQQAPAPQPAFAPQPQQQQPAPQPAFAPQPQQQAPQAQPATQQWQPPAAGGAPPAAPWGAPPPAR